MIRLSCVLRAVHSRLCSATRRLVRAFLRCCIPPVWVDASIQAKDSVPEEGVNIVDCIWNFSSNIFVCKYYTPIMNTGASI